MSDLKARLVSAVKPRLRRVLWKALLRIDDSLAFRASPPIAAAPRADRSAAPTVSPAIESPGFARPAVVLDQDGVLATADALRVVFECMFETSSLRGLEAQLFDRVAADPGLWADHGAIVAYLREQLLGLIKRGTVDERAESAQLLQRLSVHERKSVASARAYSPAGRENPSAVFWPDPTRAKKPSSLVTELPFAEGYRFIDRETPIGSAGSCFAMEIAHRLQADGFNYVITEPAPSGPHGYSNACARWGTIFNTPSFRQLVERAFGVSSPSPLLWSNRIGDHLELRDPYREDVAFASLEEFEADSRTHLVAVREALLKCKVFVLTLGVNEVWRLKSDRSVFSRAPWRVAANLVESQVLSVEDNMRELQAMLDLWRRYNPEVKFVVSVSPVPLHATFRADDRHVITANTHSKATLRVVAEEFVRRNRDVFYFPSYEVVMYCTKDAWEADQRHVSRVAVDKVMTLFHRMFLSGDVAAAQPRAAARTSASS
jgi:hypothetical protein